MTFFRRLFGGSKGEPEPADAGEDPTDSAVDAEDATSEGEGDLTRTGPSDSDGEPAPKGYLDLGALYVPRVPGLQLRGKFEKDKKVLSRMLLVLGQTGITVSVAAAPKSGGAWEELSEQIEGAITAAGGKVARVEGPYGTELDARIAGALPDGTLGYTPLRIVGVEGPRWLVRLDIQGTAISGDEEAREAAEDLIDALIVNRGPEPKIRFELLPFQLPQEAVDGSN